MPAKLAGYLKRNKGMPAKLAGYLKGDKEARAKLHVSGHTSPAAEAASGEYYKATVTGQDKVDVSSANLGSAKRIVAAGRGFKAEEDLKLAEDLAAAIGAELACSRPLAEGADWMSADRYIGVSGQSVAPDLYIAVGISGQIQHTVGMVDSKVVVAVNNDDKAPIFEGADYGIVADLYEALPAIVEAAK